MFRMYLYTCVHYYACFVCIMHVLLAYCEVEANQVYGIFVCGASCFIASLLPITCLSRIVSEGGIVYMYSIGLLCYGATHTHNTCACTHTQYMCMHTHTVIHEPPVDQTTRMGENATFTCVASGFRINWIIIRNGETCSDCGRSEGFWFSEDKFGHSDHEDMYMIVQATVWNNNTQVICQAFDHGGVEQSAVLIVQGMILLSRSCVFVCWKQSPASYQPACILCTYVHKHA